MERRGNRIPAARLPRCLRVKFREGITGKFDVQQTGMPMELGYGEVFERIQKDSKNRDDTTPLRGEYAKWVNENHKKLNDSIQAGWVDCVTNGKKDEVGSEFVVVDIQSAN